MFGWLNEHVAKPELKLKKRVSQLVFPNPTDHQNDLRNFLNRCLDPIPDFLNQSPWMWEPSDVNLPSVHFDDYRGLGTTALNNATS